MARYPRDLSGYGQTPPKANWPNGAKIAVQFVVNYEEGGENCVLHGDAGSEAFLSEIVGATSWVNQRHWNMESIYDYGARAGFWRLHRLLKDLPVTVFGVATALARSPEQVAAMIEADWEIASHGLKWIEHKDMPEDQERAEMDAVIKLHSEVVGAPPRGWYTGRCSINTVRLAAEKGCFDWVSDAYDDDIPHWEEYGNVQQLIIPYTLDANDMRFATPQGFNSGSQFFEYLKDTFDELYREGGRMMSVGLHCRLAGRPGRVAAVRKFIEYAQSHSAVWFATRGQIANHWAQVNPFKARMRPSRLSRDEFVQEFGGVFEHSPWIAERAHRLELGPAHDTATGLHNALCRIFRAADPDQRLAVLKAHPDLAGKLASAKRLTKESAAEQSSAGLDALTDDERAEFTRLNENYTKKFGHPFIVAVRDHTKMSILQAFSSRIENSPAQELDTACRQVERIAEFRLRDKLKV